MEVLSLGTMTLLLDRDPRFFFGLIECSRNDTSDSAARERDPFPGGLGGEEKDPVFLDNGDARSVSMPISGATYLAISVIMHGNIPSMNLG